MKRLLKFHFLVTPRLALLYKFCSRRCLQSPRASFRVSLMARTKTRSVMNFPVLSSGRFTHAHSTERRSPNTPTARPTRTRYKDGLVKRADGEIVNVYRFRHPHCPESNARSFSKWRRNRHGAVKVAVENGTREMSLHSILLANMSTRMSEFLAADPNTQSAEGGETCTLCGHFCSYYNSGKDYRMALAHRLLCDKTQSVPLFLTPADRF